MHPDDAQSALQDLVRHVIEADLRTTPGFGESFADDYAPWLSDPQHAARFLRVHLDMLQLASLDLADKDVLDVGCGFGLTLVLCGLLGASSMHGIEPNPRRISTIEAYLPMLPSELWERIHAREGSADSLPYEDESFDVVLCVESIGVYLDVPGFLSEAARVLRPGGELIVAWRSNGLNGRIRRRTLQIWQAYEKGPAGQTIHGHRIDNPYVDKRAGIISGRFPDLGADEVRRLAENTAHMTMDEILAGCEKYVEHGVLPSSAYQHGEPPVAPEGMFVERLMQPLELADHLAARGVEPAVYGYWGGAGGHRAVRAANRLLTRGGRFTLRTAPAFRIVGTKRQGAAGAA